MILKINALDIFIRAEVGFGFKTIHFLEQ